MPIDADTPQSPGWWLTRLSRDLVDRQSRIDGLYDRFEGNPPLPRGAETAREAYQAFQRTARTNYAELIVEAVRERMTPTGFRTAADDDENGDQVAADLWEASGLDVEFADVLEAMLVSGVGYVIVGGVPEGERWPVVTGEDPRQVIAVHDPVRRRVTRAAAKLFHDLEMERDFAFLYLPGRRWVASRQTRRRSANLSVRFASSAWDWSDEHGGAEGEAVPGPVPVVEFRNRNGVGEFERHIDLLDRINFTLLQRMVITVFQAFKQRAVTGLPAEDEDGNEISLAEWAELFTADPGAIWTIPEGVAFWESGQVDLTPVLTSVKDDVRDLAAVTRTPLSYLVPDAAGGSAEGASLMREGHVFKTEDRIVRATQGIKDVMSLAFARMGDADRADRSRLSVLWAPAERWSLAERADAASKAQDVPWRTRMQHIWGFTPRQVEQMDVERGSDVLLAAAFAAPDTQQLAEPAGPPVEAGVAGGA